MHKIIIIASDVKNPYETPVKGDNMFGYEVLENSI
jgi:hypothetical protein